MADSIASLLTSWVGDEPLDPRAIELGVNWMTLRSWMRGTTIPADPMLHALAAVLKLNLVDLRHIAAADRIRRLAVARQTLANAEAQAANTPATTRQHSATDEAAGLERAHATDPSEAVRA